MPDFEILNLYVGMIAVSVNGDLIRLHRCIAINRDGL
jgi:hypothetical protein